MVMNFFSTKKFNKGFTIIEVLVVISIVSTLTGIVWVNVNSARMKARDAKKTTELKNIQTALYAFLEQYGRMPNNYNPGQGACQGQTYYDQSMQELVDAKLLGNIPYNTGGGVGYCYYNYGAGNSLGGVLVTSLEAVPDTTNGVPPSCRWNPPGVNWCNQNNSKEYCLCSPY